MNQTIAIRDPIQKKLIQFVEQRLAFDPSNHIGTGDLLSEGVLDSLDMLKLSNYIELTYRIKIEDGEMTPENFDTIERIAAFVMRKMSTSPRVSFFRR
jgi:acyl carrier protein